MFLALLIIILSRAIHLRVVAQSDHWEYVKKIKKRVILSAFGTPLAALQCIAGCTCSLRSGVTAKFTMAVEAKSVGCLALTGLTGESDKDTSMAYCQALPFCSITAWWVGGRSIELINCCWMHPFANTIFTDVGCAAVTLSLHHRWVCTFHGCTPVTVTIRLTVHWRLLKTVGGFTHWPTQEMMNVGAEISAPLTRQ